MAEKQYLVLVDRLAKYEGTGDERVRVTFEKGEKVTLSDADAKRHLASGAVTADLKADPEAEPEYPTTHAGLNALADANDFEFPAGTKTVADKTAALESAGIGPA